MPLGPRRAGRRHRAGRVAGSAGRQRPDVVGTYVGLGRRAAVFQPTRRDDTPVNFHLGGGIGAW